ncbi:hypothetical protein HK103_003652 [Boothiomyces macroporosus]|uniref:Uncharacterized protein n=1 Tax=Boothiomyces macroporosus TaxID=261099 RepID=A0AAD5UKF9_9FUNG|nr:hypothetical protein HK103_003652 [Boothiomyces macroporosus]
MVTGSSDGTICISDTIEFKLIRNFNFRSRSLAEDKRVSNLIVSAKSIICSQGPLVVSWEFRQPPKKKSQRSRNKIKIPIQVPRNTSLNAEELYEEVVDALEEIKTEKSLKGKMNDRILKYNGDPNVHQMCEEDLLSYAMILSRDNLQEVPDQLSEQEMMDLALAISLSESNK